MLLTIVLKIFNFQAFASTCFRLHHRLQNTRKEPAIQSISSRCMLKFVGEGNLYLSALHLKNRILKSVIFFKSTVII